MIRKFSRNFHCLPSFTLLSVFSGFKLTVHAYFEKKNLAILGKLKNCVMAIQKNSSDHGLLSTQSIV